MTQVVFPLLDELGSSRLLLGPYSIIEICGWFPYSKFGAILIWNLPQWHYEPIGGFHADLLGFKSKNPTKAAVGQSDGFAKASLWLGSPDFLSARYYWPYLARLNPQNTKRNTFGPAFHHMNEICGWFPPICIWGNPFWHETYHTLVWDLSWPHLPRLAITPKKEFFGPRFHDMVSPYLGQSFLIWFFAGLHYEFLADFLPIWWDLKF